MLYLFFFFSLIRLEFNQSHLDYYTELDAVILYGKPARNDLPEEAKPRAAANESEVSLTANLFQQLSLSGKTATDGQEDLETTAGYFDILPVGLINSAAVINLTVSCMTFSQKIHLIFLGADLLFDLIFGHVLLAE